MAEQIRLDMVTRYLSRIIHTGSFMLLGLAIACSPRIGDEVARAGSPGGDVDAVLFETNGGATTSFGYRVYLVPHGQSAAHQSDDEVANLYGAVRNPSAYGANLRWVGNDTLQIEYEFARRDTVMRPVVQVAGHDVYVSLHPGVSDPTAPSGGMLYNLSRNQP